MDKMVAVIEDKFKPTEKIAVSSGDWLNTKLRYSSAGELATIDITWYGTLNPARFVVTGFFPKSVGAAYSGPLSVTPNLPLDPNETRCSFALDAKTRGQALWTAEEILDLLRRFQSF